MSDFVIFWSVYPRRVAKKDAERAWRKLTPTQRVAAMEALPKHIERWSDPAFIPYPASWLNGERWEDELEAIEPKRAPNWWESDPLTLAHGRTKGIHPRPGESMSDYRARLRAA